MQDTDYPPAVTPRLRRQVILPISLAVLIVALGITTAIYPLYPGHPRSLSPLEQKQLTSQLAAARSPAPSEDQWVESRDGDGALDIEDINGPATIYFDKQSRTRLLCIENIGCYHLRGHHEANK
ncbi:hypothetical protein HDF16_005976 [Granulicella aggregans]|uniref:Uncharacterized protein n=1 Tax=Granulicella aggregans TaxID=474949 RepID=A0A7W7ZJU8_9BACT|nr:hypothetical protein [Granulicella aggregans]MBB5061240.1 hypothetical protein [Granulicella aggregans]